VILRVELLKHPASYRIAGIFRKNRIEQLTRGCKITFAERGSCFVQFDRLSSLAFDQFNATQGFDVIRIELQYFPVGSERFVDTAFAAGSGRFLHQRACLALSLVNLLHTVLFGVLLGCLLHLTQTFAHFSFLDQICSAAPLAISRAARDTGCDSADDKHQRELTAASRYLLHDPTLW
jgi:hypothetical protein